MRIVVKVGSALLSNPEGGLHHASVENIAAQLSQLHSEGHDVILVTSGAIAAGVGRLHLSERPKDLRLKQAAAAVGQLALMDVYEVAFSKRKIVAAQMLLTREDLMHRERYLNVRNTLLTLLELRTIPIINENDSVSTEEIQFGDNDSLSAIVATKVDADKLIILSDVAGLFELDENGRVSDRLIHEVPRVTAEFERHVSSERGSKLSTGGMAAKLSAAKMATAAGVEMWIASGRIEAILSRVVAGDSSAGTRFCARPQKIQTRQAWIAFGRKTKGSLVIDGGAHNAVVHLKKSLLPSGIKSVRGTFSIGDTVAIRSTDGNEIARGLVNFSSSDLKAIRGRQTKDIPGILGTSTVAEVVHRDNMVLL